MSVLTDQAPSEPQVSPAGYRAGEGEPLVLLHGFTATWRCWIPILDALSQRYAVFAPTLAGHDGGAPFPDERGHSIADAAANLEQELLAAGIDSAHFVGNSMGGALALELAKRGMARTVVGLSPSGGWHPGDREEARIEKLFRRQLRMTRQTEKLLPRLVGRPRMRRLLFRDVVYRGERMKPEEALALAHSSLRCTITEQAFETLRSGQAALRDLDQVKVPVLIVWGEHDRILPPSRHLDRFRTELPNVEIRMLPKAGHLPMTDEPEFVARAIADWVDAHSGETEQPGPGERDTERAAAGQT